jgi:hypothetical protein
VRGARGLLRRSLAGALALLSPAADASEPERAAAWRAWEEGDFETAGRLGAALATRPGRQDEGLHVRVLAAHVRGEHAQAIAAHGRIAPRYRRLGELDEPILWSYLHLGDVAGARAFADRRGIAARDRAVRARLELASERPLEVRLSGLVELPFTDDALSPWMPGFAARVAGREVVARLDTGGSFVHLTAGKAAALGIRTVACEKAFAALQSGRVCYGVTDLELGAGELRNVPVVVHDEGVLSSQGMAEAFGVELGPIVGTNLLRPFLATVDGPGRRLLLSRRGDEPARAEHLARLAGDAVTVPFALWGEHMMIARGRVGEGLEVNLFVDSGLVAVTQEQGQASLLAPESSLSGWGASRGKRGGPASRFAQLPSTLALGEASAAGATVFVVSDRTWRQFGDWGGVRVSGLVSWGFLKEYSWTLDFDRMLYELRRR